MANRLIKERSPYLKKSAHQPVDWYPWCEEAFRKAKEENKPILLSVGAVWCHWCHVMAKECFENPEIAQIINENFVAIKVDRDERPDIDRRYQEVVVSLTGSGGWPLTVFLTPDGKAFFGGTYFPPEDRWGRPGFKSLLLRIAQLWKEDRDRVIRSAEHIFELLRNYSSSSHKDNVGEELLNRGIANLLASVDYQYGGIGTAPKFHHARAFELLLYHHFFTGQTLPMEAVEITLDSMARGGIYDHLGGGFFRYSTDDRWIVPHFEKMLSDNAELLLVYSLAFQVTKKDLYRYVVEGILNYYQRFGFDEGGGFYASQDADIGDLDEGGYYTFSLEELRGILTEEEVKVTSLYFDIHPKGEMHHDPSKNVLFIAMSEEEVATATGIPLERVRQLLESARRKMLSYRESTRQQPFIDKTIYTNWNGLMLEALSTCYKVFRIPWVLSSAEKTADRLMKEMWRDGQLMHTYGVKGMAEDYIFLARGLLSLFEVTQKREYLEASVMLAHEAIKKFWDPQGWGFFDTEEKDEGLLRIRLKTLQDTPTQSVNGAAPYLYLVLGSITPYTEFLEYAEKNLQAFARMVREIPLISPSYLISLYAYLKGIYKVETETFFEDILSSFRPFKVVLRSPVKGVVVCEGSSCRVYEGIPDSLS